MPNILIRISYDGTGYSGFQLQPNALTIQGELERAIAVIYKRPLRITGAGRTDAGVHARGQAANFRAPFHIAAEKLPHALNAMLPSDIVVTEAAEVPESFHARFSALRKTYSYTLDRSEYPSVFKRLYTMHLPGELNLAAMRSAAALFTGTHDFKAFRVTGGAVIDTTRTLYRVEIDENRGSQLLALSFEGSGFLYRMVRLMTGSLIRVGQGRLTEEELKAALGEGYTKAAGPTAPASGLCLEKVDYDRF